MIGTINGKRLACAAAVLAAALSGVLPAHADGTYYYRAKPALIVVSGPSAPSKDNLSISLSVPSPFALTTGQAVSLPLAVDGATDGLTYRAAAAASMPGLSVDPTTGAVSGAPSAAAGTSYSIAVEAVRDGEVVAVTAAASGILRDPIVVTAVPDAISLLIGDDFPTTGIGAQATGGDPATLAWSLEGAPDWLGIVTGAEPGDAVLALKGGKEITETTSTTVTLVAKDGENREDSSKSFSVAVLPLPTKLLDDHGVANAAFGKAVSLSADGHTALVGAQTDDDMGVYSGSATAFDWDGSSWIARPKLVAPDGAPSDYFGNSVSLSADGSRALIGVRYDDDKGDRSGSAWIFDWNGSTWSSGVKIVDPNGQASDEFGASVALSADGSTALVGAVYDDDKGSNSGSAVIFKWNGTSWNQETKILALDGLPNDHFGYSVSLSTDGTTAAVGALDTDHHGSGTGAVYVYHRKETGWTQRAMITGSGGNEFLGASASLSADGNTVLVGAYGWQSGRGYAQVYDWDGNGWIARPRLLAPDGKASDSFGISTALSADGQTALVGSSLDDIDATDNGSAWTFRWNGATWAAGTQLSAPDGAAGDHFGVSVSLSADGQKALIGAEADDDKGSNSGSAYVVPVP